LTARRAHSGDASQITDLFEQEYDRYFGKFSDDELLSESLESATMSIEGGESPWGVVYVLQDGHGDVRGVSALKNNRSGWCEYSSTVIQPEARGEGGYPALHRRRREAHKDYFPDTKGYTQTVSFSAKSQNGSLGAGFVPVGYSDAQFFEANKGDGRISTAYMLDSNEEYTAEAEIHVPEGPIRDAASKAVENLNGCGVDIDRSFVSGGREPGKLEVQARVSPGIGQARLTALGDRRPGSETREYEEVLGWIEDQKEKPAIEWIGVEVDAAIPAAGALVQDTEMDFERYQPDGARTPDGWRDLLGLQHRPQGPRNRELIEPVFEIVKKAGLPSSYREDLGEFSETAVHRVEMG
jgi:hypothetical protein